MKKEEFKQLALELSEQFHVRCCLDYHNYTNCEEKIMVLDVLADLEKAFPEEAEKLKKKGFFRIGYDWQWGVYRTDKPINITAVVAGNYSEFYTFLKTVDENVECIFVTEPTNLKGANVTNVIYIGSFWQNPILKGKEYEEFKKMLLVSSDIPLEKIEHWKVIKAWLDLIAIGWDFNRPDPPEPIPPFAEVEEKLRELCKISGDRSFSEMVWRASMVYSLTKRTDGANIMSGPGYILGEYAFSPGDIVFFNNGEIAGEGTIFKKWGKNIAIKYDGGRIFGETTSLFKPQEIAYVGDKSKWSDRQKHIYRCLVQLSES